VVDKTLADLVKKGDQQAFKKMYELCISYVYSIVNRYVSNESDYKDVIQEIFARVFTGIKSYDPKKGEFKYWLRRLVINQCMTHYRKHKKPATFISMDDINEIEMGYETQSFELKREDIEKQLDEMPEGYKQVFMMVVLDDYSHKEVAEILDVTPETSRSQLFRAKKWLRGNTFNNNLKSVTGGLIG
jgi:RNA polymerase sigma-70 factor (ECF subfamily)